MSAATKDGTDLAMVMVSAMLAADNVDARHRLMHEAIAGIDSPGAYAFAAGTLAATTARLFCAVVGLEGDEALAAWGKFTRAWREEP